MFFRFLVGGIVVALFSVLGDILKPKSFAGLFGAAPSVALATLGLTIASNGTAYAALEARSMIGGAIALFAYTWSVMWVMSRYKPSAFTLPRSAFFLFGLRLPLALGLYSSNSMPVRLNLSALRQTKWYEIALQFLFGGLATVRLA